MRTARLLMSSMAPNPSGLASVMIEAFGCLPKSRRSFRDGFEHRRLEAGYEPDASLVQLAGVEEVVLGPFVVPGSSSADDEFADPGETNASPLRLPDRPCPVPL